MVGDWSRHTAARDRSRLCLKIGAGAQAASKGWLQGLGDSHEVSRAG